MVEDEDAEKLVPQVKSQQNISLVDESPRAAQAIEAPTAEIVDLNPEVAPEAKQENSANQANSTPAAPFSLDQMLSLSFTPKALNLPKMNNSKWSVSEELEEKVRNILVAKRDVISLAEYPRETMADADDLQKWVAKQTSFRLQLDKESEEFKKKVIKTVAKLFGDEILYNMYMGDRTLNELQKHEKIIDEILFELEARFVRTLSDGD